MAQNGSGFLFLRDFFVRVTITILFCGKFFFNAFCRVSTAVRAFRPRWIGAMSDKGWRSDREQAPLRGVRGLPSLVDWHCEAGRNARTADRDADFSTIKLSDDF